MASSGFRTALPLLLCLASTGALAERPVQIVSEGRIGNAWSPATPLTDPAYPQGTAVAAGDVCVNIGYYLGPDGVPSQFAYLKSWSEASRDPKALDVFAQTAVATLQQRRFVPKKPSSPQPVYTSATFVFAANAGADGKALRKRCAIRDLQVFITEAQMHADPLTWEQLRWNREWFKAKNTRIHGLNRE